jgi:ABC-type transport system substrate-binding protein
MNRRHILHPIMAALFALALSLTACSLPLYGGGPAQQERTVVSDDSSWSLKLGRNWQIEDNSTTFSAVNGRERLLLWISVSPDAEDWTLADYVAGFKESSDTALASGTVGSITATTVGDALNGESMDFRFTRDDEARLMRLIALRKHGKIYLFVFQAAEDQAQRLDTEIKAITPSIRVHNRVYGFERDRIFVAAGGRAEDEFLDPAIARDGPNGYAGHLFSGLVRMTPKLNVAPDLAERWDVSPDGRVYTFTLRPNLTFADGAPLTASDVEYSWLRTADAALNSDVALTYLGDIAGYKALHAGTSKTLSGLKVIDARTLVVTLDGPKPYFLGKLSFPTSFVVDKRDISRNSKTWMRRPNGSGPFTLSKIDGDKAVILERNKAYHRPAKLEALVFYVYPAGSNISLFQSGVLDVVSIGLQDALQISAPAHPLRNQLRTVESLCTSLIQLDTAQAPMDDLAFRQALAHAIDWDALARQFEVNYDSEPWEVLPPGMAGHRERTRVQRFDPAAAKAELARSKYTGQALAIKISTPGSGTAIDSGTAAISEMWRTTLGVTVEVEQVDGKDFAREARKRRGQVVMYGWCADYPDPENFLDVLYHSQSPQNVSGLNDSVLDGLLDRARIEQDPAKRIALYQQAEDRLRDQILTIPWPRLAAHMLVKPYLKNYATPPMGVRQLELIDVLPDAKRK